MVFDYYYSLHLIAEQNSNQNFFFYWNNSSQ